jgi:hypothetical protein
MNGASMTFPTRTIQELHAVCHFLNDFPPRWWLGGGWAIDAWLGRQTREHEDIEICVFRSDQRAIYAYCPDWQYFTPQENNWSPIPVGTRLNPPQFMLQLQQTPATGITIPNMPPTFEFLLNDRQDDAWIQHDELEVRLPIGQVSGMTPLGIPAAVPELVLLHKAWTVERAKDDHDFQQIRDQLPADQRAWLSRHIARTRPDHRWLPALRADE